MKTDSQDKRYLGAAAQSAGALERLDRRYEADRDQRRDLLQDIQLAIWRSIGTFDGRCSERTWVYRVAHNAAATYVGRQRRRNSRHLAGLEDLTNMIEASGPDDAKHIWRKQPSEDLVMMLANIHERAHTFQTQVKQRNVRDAIEL